MREIRAKLAKFAGTGDVNDVGAEFFESTANFVLVTPEEEVIAQVALDAEAGPAAGQFEMGDAAVLALGEARTAEHGEQRTSAALGEIDELACGESHAIDLVKRFAEKRYAGLKSHV